MLANTETTGDNTLDAPRRTDDLKPAGSPPHGAIAALPAMRMECLHGDRLATCYTGRNRDLHGMLSAAVSGQPDAPAVRDGAREWTYAQLDAWVERLAHGLASLGIASGDRVALFMGNRAEYLALLHATWRLGAVAVPIGTRQSRSELRNMLAHSGARLLAFEESLRERMPDAADIPGVEFRVNVDGANGQGETGLEALEVEAAAGSAAVSTGHAAEFAGPPDEQSAACLMYTSGTTGAPKGALLAHLGFWHTAENYRHRFGYGQGERFLLVIPASHISGLVAVVVSCLHVAGCVVLQREFNAAAALDAIESSGITSAVLVPAMYNLCLLQPDIAQRRLSTWRIGHFGGAPMPAVTIERLAALIPGLSLRNGYGATETTSAVTLGLPQDAVDAPDTVGTILPNMDVRVLDAAGAEVAPGEPGELWVRSPGNAMAYWNDPEATRASFVGGYWRSGDVGLIDSAGRIALLDRIKDMINRGGYKVYASELENHILRLPGVVEAAAVPRPCPVLGERIHVFIHATRDVPLDDLRAHCRAQLADYKTPDFLTQGGGPLPRNLNGKLAKPAIRARALALASTTTE